MRLRLGPKRRPSPRSSRNPRSSRERECMTGITMSRRRKKHAEAENHERWLISYADFITLLFAFFVVMFASSQTDKSKAQAMAQAVKDAFEKGRFSTNVTTILGGTIDDLGKG